MTFDPGTPSAYLAASVSVGLITGAFLGGATLLIGLVFLNAGYQVDPPRLAKQVAAISGLAVFTVGCVMSWRDFHSTSETD